MPNIALIEDLAIILCVAAVVTILFHKIKQPPVLGYLIAGLIIGPYTPPFSLIEGEAEIRILAELGVIFLLFSIGLEFNLNKLAKMGFPVIVIGVFEVLAMILIGFWAGSWLGWSSYDSLLLGAALSISSTTIIIKALEDLNLKKQLFAKLMVGILITEDILAMLLMVVISTMAFTEHIFSSAMFFETTKLLLVLISWFLIGYFSIPYLMRKIQDSVNDEALTVTSIGLCLFLSTIAAYFNYSIALGAFMMGSILAATPQVRRIEILIRPIRDMFAAVFFVSIGMLIDPKIIFTCWPYVAILSGVTIIGKILSSGIGALVAGQSIETSLKIGFGMAQIGEFSFIIIGVSSAIHPTDSIIYPIIVAISVITTFLTPYFIKYSIKLSQPIKHLIPHKINTLIHQYNLWMTNFLMHQLIFKVEYPIRFLMNGIIVAIICTTSFQFLIPLLLRKIHDFGLVKYLGWLVTMGVASPFIWAMLSSGIMRRSFHSKWKRIKKLFFVSVCWLIIGAELFFFNLQFFQSWSIALTLTIGTLGLLRINSKRLKKIYFKLEANLMENLKVERNENEDK